MKYLHYVVGACGVLLAPAALAGEMSVSGTGYGKAANTVHMVSEGHMLVEMSTAYDKFELEDAENPMNGMSGPCFGAMEVKGGAVSGGGRCLYTDADGDTVSMQWTPEKMGEDGAIMGVWSVSGGTGKWMEASGGGEFSSRTDQTSGENVNTVSGAVMLP